MSDYHQYLKVFAQQLNITPLKDENIPVIPSINPETKQVDVKSPAQDYRQLHIPFPESPNTKPSPQLNLPNFEVNEVKCSAKGCDTIGIVNEDMHLDPKDQKYYCSEHDGKCENCSERTESEKLVHARGAGMICEKCSSEDFFYCEHCDEIVPDDEIVKSSSRFQTRSNGRNADYIGCDKCSAQCESCGKAKNQEYMKNYEGSWYCEECFSEAFTYCEDCKDYTSSEDAHYVDGESLCPYHYNESYFRCEECDEDFKKEQIHDVVNSRGRDIQVCNECFQDEYGGAEEGEEEQDGKTVAKLPKSFENYESVSDLHFNKKMRNLNQLKKFLPLSVKDLKTKFPILFTKLGDLISFAHGKTITKEIVEAYEKALPTEDFQLGYSTWNGMQRSIRNPKSPQLVINIKAGPEFIAKLEEDPILKDLFDKINVISKQSGHPNATNQIGWARLELDPNKEFILVDEIQTDHMNGLFKIKNDKGYGELAQIRAKYKEVYRLTDEQFDAKLAKGLNIIKDFPDVATQAISDFARKNGFKKIFWHTYESGKELKGNYPPKSLYTKVPEENFFTPSDSKPFGLNGQFLEREAKSKNNIIKLARRIYFQYLA